MARAEDLLDENEVMAALGKYREAVEFITENKIPAEDKLHALRSYLEALENKLPPAVEEEIARRKEDATGKISHLPATMAYHMARFWVEYGAYDAARGYLETAAEDDRLDTEKREWAANRLDNIDEDIRRVEEEELLAVQETTEEAHELLDEALRLRKAGKLEEAGELEQVARGLKSRIIVQKCTMALERNAFPVVAKRVSENRRLLREKEDDQNVQKILEVAREWEEITTAQQELEEAAEAHDTEKSLKALGRIKNAELEPVPFEQLLPELSDAENALLDVYSPDKKLAGMPDEEELGAQIGQAEKEQAINKAYLGCARNFAEDNMTQAGEYGLEVIELAEDEFRLERDFAGRVFVVHSIMTAERKLEDGELQAASEQVETLRETHLYATERNVRNEVQRLGSEIQKALDRRDARALLDEAEEHLQRGELDQAEDKIESTRSLETYPQLAEVRNRVSQLSARVSRQARIERSVEEKTEDIEIILYSVGKKASEWDFETAELLLERIEWARNYNAIPSLGEMYEEKLAVLESEKEEAEEQHGEAVALLEEGEDWLEAGQLEDVEERLERLRERTVYTRSYENFNDRVRELAGKVAIAKEEAARAEAESILDEIEELINKGEYIEADKMVTEAQGSRHYEEMRDFQRQINNLGSELKRVERRAELLYRRATDAYYEEDLETLRTILEELEEQYENTRFYAEHS